MARYLPAGSSADSFYAGSGVKATEPTGMDKLLAGLTGATNCAFVNEPGLADALCGGCTAIALFNQANNAPSFGGGFKSRVKRRLAGDDSVTGYMFAFHYLA